MAVTTGVYVKGAKAWLDGTIDPTALGVMLVNDTYTPDFDLDEFRDDLTGEPGDSGTYASGGSALSGESVVISGSTVELRATNPQWTGATLSATGCVIYHRRGGLASADELLACLEFSNGTVASTNGTYTIDFSGANDTLIVATPNP